MHEKYLRPGLPFALAHLSEELGELTKVLGEMQAAVGKIQRWGLQSVNPEIPPEQRETNEAWLKRAYYELGLELSDTIKAYERFKQEAAANPSFKGLAGD